jgi:hypothetical protein
MPRRRKNAEFTRKYIPTTIDDVFAEFGVVDDAIQAQANRRLVDKFYKALNRAFPGDAIIYIPPPTAIRPKLSEEQQALVFADYAVRKITPIALDAAGLDPDFGIALNAAGLKAKATKLRKLAKIVDYDTADAVVDIADNIFRSTMDTDYNASEVALAASAAARAICHADADGAAYHAARAADYAARLNPEAVWDAVTDMLYAL